MLTNNSNTHTLSISRNKGNQTMKLDQLIEYIIFLEKSYTKSGGETIPRPFSKKSKLSESISLSFKQVFFICQGEGCQNIFKTKLVSTPLALTSYKALKSKKEVWN